MFALVADEVFYVKADAENRAEFLARDLVPFSYATKHGRRETMAYYTVPTEALDSSPLLCEWARQGMAAAERAAEGKGRPRKKTAR